MGIICSELRFLHCSHCSYYYYDIYLGYTDLGDFWFEEGASCDSQNNVYYTFYASTGIVIITMSLILRHVLININGNPKIKRYKDPKFLFPWLFLLFNIVVLIGGILKISTKKGSSSPLVGRDTAITVFAATGPFLAHTGLVAYYYVVLKLLKSFTNLLSLQDRKDLDHKFSILTLLTLSIPVISFFSSFSITMGLIYTHHYVTFYQVICSFSFH